jgi:hypothetical protein
MRTSYIWYINFSVDIIGGKQAVFPFSRTGTDPMFSDNRPLAGDHLWYRVSPWPTV